MRKSFIKYPILFWLSKKFYIFLSIFLELPVYLWDGVKEWIYTVKSNLKEFDHIYESEKEK